MDYILVVQDFVRIPGEVQFIQLITNGQENTSYNLILIALYKKPYFTKDNKKAFDAQTDDSGIVVVKSSSDLAPDLKALFVTEFLYWNDYENKEFQLTLSALRTHSYY